MACALDLLDAGRSVVLLERSPAEGLGGLARWAFGGVFLVDSPEQRRSGIRDSVELALDDWHAYAEFGPDDLWPRRWAEAYVHRCCADVRGWLRRHGVRFFPAVHWAERGLYGPGNSVPRFHLAWGTGEGMVRRLASALRAHPKAERLRLAFGHTVEELCTEGGRFVGCAGSTADGERFRAEGDALVLASGGIAGNLELVREHWYSAWGAPPPDMLNGSHPQADGRLLLAAREQGARLTHLDKQWHYAAGIAHYAPRFPGQGLSVVPPKSALWLDPRGERIGPAPLVGNFDTRYCVERVCRLPEQYSWLLFNRRIARRELAVSGAEHNPEVRDERWLAFLAKVLFGSTALVDELVARCEDVVVGRNLEELAGRMNARVGRERVDPRVLERTVRRYDANVRRGALSNDDQLRRIAHARRYRGDRLRTCRRAVIDDPRGRPLVAMHLRVVTRKSLGGLQTDLEGRVLGEDGAPLPGLYAVGEAAGFGGGGIHGLRSLEGTFLGGCVFTGRVTARALVRGAAADA
ncbi:MAG: FAD-binding dehydrogenase [Planctomycetota bacterium]|nr:MAG: FAD-binding dehydrogenase [Planctomycetota bacterium]